MGRYSNHRKLFTTVENLLNIELARSPAEKPRAPMQVQHRLRAEEQTELLERYLAGERAFVLCEAYNVHRTTIDRLLRSTGLRRHRSMTEVEITEATHLYADGWSCARIGAELGRNPGTVWRALQATGLELRRPWDRP